MSYSLQLGSVSVRPADCPMSGLRHKIRRPKLSFGFTWLDQRGRNIDVTSRVATYQRAHLHIQKSPTSGDLTGQSPRKIGRDRRQTAPSRLWSSDLSGSERWMARQPRNLHSTKKSRIKPVLPPPPPLSFLFAWWIIIATISDKILSSVGLHRFVLNFRLTLRARQFFFFFQKFNFALANSAKSHRGDFNTHRHGRVL